jgi:hypothetical protein
MAAETGEFKLQLEQDIAILPLSLKDYLLLPLHLFGLWFLLDDGVSQTGSNDQLVSFGSLTTRYRSIAIVDRGLSFGSAISRQQKFAVIACDSAFIGIAAFLLYCTLYYTNL